MGSSRQERFSWRFEEKKAEFFTLIICNAANAKDIFEITGKHKFWKKSRTWPLLDRISQTYSAAQTIEEKRDALARNLLKNHSVGVENSLKQSNRTEYITSSFQNSNGRGLEHSIWSR